MALAVEIRHIPAVLFVVIVVGVGRVVGGGDRLCVRSWGAVVKVHAAEKNNMNNLNHMEMEKRKN
jgi:hypothetical protein